MKKQTPFKVTLSLRLLLIFVIVNVVLIAAFTWSTSFGKSSTTTPTLPTASLTSVPSVTLSPSPQPSDTAEATVEVEIPAAVAPGFDSPISQGLMLYAAEEQGYAHLFAYAAGRLPVTRLTANPWDDITPAFSPDGKTVAYASRANGYFDLFLLDLASGVSTRLTDNAEYEASPTWSPDGQWLAYEAYINNNMDIYVRSVYDPNQPVIRLTDNAGPDYAPRWSPLGRQIAFVSIAGGEPDIWLADLDVVDGRFNNLSASPNSAESHPVWSPDGSSLAWSASLNGTSTVLVRQLQDPDAQLHSVGNGNLAAWSPDGAYISTALELPNQNYLTAYAATTRALALPPLELPGRMHGMDWKQADLPSPLPASFKKSAEMVTTPLWTANVTALEEAPAGRLGVVPLEDVSSPSAFLHDQVDESFYALRDRIGREIGWDFLASLENAFVPITKVLPPAMKDDWLGTGRSIAVNALPLSANFMVITREDFGAQTYWRVYLRARYQDGSQGAPLFTQPWDVSARYSGDTQAYEKGGALANSVPAGYWVDFTSLAQVFSWERLPALVNWRTYYPGMRFNQFVQTGGLDWQTAMLELYPREVLITPTPLATSSSTPTPTPRWMLPRTATPTRTPSPTPSPTSTPTRRATWTPIAP